MRPLDPIDPTPQPDDAPDGAPADHEARAPRGDVRGVAVDVGIAEAPSTPAGPADPGPSGSEVTAPVAPAPTSEVPPRLEVDEARRRRIRPWAIAAAVVVVLVCGGVILSYTPIVGARTVEVEGADRLAPRRVMRLAGIALGTNVLHLDERAAEARLEADPWIARAVVTSSLPSTITIAVREREPVLVLEGADGSELLAADGTPLGRAPGSAGLPILEAASDATLDRRSVAIAGGAVRAMAPSLRARVDRVVVTPDGLSLLVDGSIEVGFGGPTDALAKAQALRAILDYAAREDRSLLSVDVSVPGAPTATFVGSQASESVPDPSAARETDRSDRGRDRGNGERGEGSDDRASGSDDTSA